MEEHNGEEIKPSEEKQVEHVAPPEEIKQEPQVEHVKPVEKGPGFFAKSMASLKRFSIECKRVLKVTKKPDKEEFKTIVKISGIGLLIIGFMGFVLHFIKEIIM